MALIRGVTNLREVGLRVVDAQVDAGGAAGGRGLLRGGLQGALLHAAPQRKSTSGINVGDSAARLIERTQAPAEQAKTAARAALKDDDGNSTKCQSYRLLRRGANGIRNDGAVRGVVLIRVVQTLQTSTTNAMRND